MQISLLIQTLFTGGRVIMDYELIFELWEFAANVLTLYITCSAVNGCRQTESKSILMLDLFQVLMLTDGLECCGLLWCFYQTLILTAPIHCRASIAETLMHFYKPDEETHSSWSSDKFFFLNFKFSFWGVLPLKSLKWSDQNYNLSE